MMKSFYKNTKILIRNLKIHQILLNLVFKFHSLATHHIQTMLQNSKIL
jgi:hypothetical protein